MIYLVSKAAFDVIFDFLSKPEVWTIRGSAQLANDLYYIDYEIEIPDERLKILYD